MHLYVMDWQGRCCWNRTEFRRDSFLLVETERERHEKGVMPWHMHYGYALGLKFGAWNASWKPEERFVTLIFGFFPLSTKLTPSHLMAMVLQMSCHISSPQNNDFDAFHDSINSTPCMIFSFTYNTTYSPTSLQLNNIRVWFTARRKYILFFLQFLTLQTFFLLSFLYDVMFMLPFLNLNTDP